MKDLNFKRFTVEVQFEEEVTIRDEFGWVEGHAPGNGNYKKTKETKYVRTTQEAYVRGWVEYWYQKCRNVEIVSITSEIIQIDAVIQVEN